MDKDSRWIRPIIITTIGGVLGAVIWTLLVLPATKNITKAFFKDYLLILGIRVDIALWIIPAVVLLAALCITLWDSLKNISNSFEDYVEDKIASVWWEWDAFNFDETLTPICPKCMFELSILQPPHDPCKMVCQRCSFKKNFGDNYDEIKMLVKKEIDRRFRTREYKFPKKHIIGLKNFWNKIRKRKKKKEVNNKKEAINSDTINDQVRTLISEAESLMVRKGIRVVGSKRVENEVTLKTTRPLSDNIKENIRHRAERFGFKVQFSYVSEGKD